MRSFGGLVACGVLLAALPGAAHGAPKVTTLFNFAPNGGAEPTARLVPDGTGKLLGVTSTGGKASVSVTNPAGTVFQLSPVTGKALWSEKVLYTFKGNADGNQPTGALFRDSTGALFGTTFRGGDPNDNGTVFKLTPPAKGSTVWKKKTIYTFTGLDGSRPFAGLVGDGNGNLFGVTTGGGASGQGTVFEISPQGANYTLTTLYAFQGPEGAGPHGGLAIDSAGVLYGTTESDTGTAQAGSVFSLSPPAAGQTIWGFTELHAFTGGTDSGYPQGAMVMDSTGHLFGTTYGLYPGNGTVFEITPSAGSATGYGYHVIFAFDGSAGSNPTGDLALDAAGNLVGTTLHSNDINSSGSVFILSPPTGGSGAWTQSYSYIFNGQSGPYSPFAGVTINPAGVAFGTGYSGGKHGVGAMFKLTP